MEITVLDRKALEYVIWIDWTEQIVSFHEEAGYESLPFLTRQSWQENIQILLAEGFRFQ